jgi:hypothetical protein
MLPSAHYKGVGVRVVTLGSREPNIFPSPPAQPQRSPSQQEQVRDFAEKDVMEHNIMH